MSDIEAIAAISGTSNENPYKQYMNNPYKNDSSDPLTFSAKQTIDPQAMQVVINELQVELQKLLALARAHPKDLSLWLQVLAVKSKKIELEKDLSKELQQPHSVSKLEVSQYLFMMDQGLSSASATGRSVESQDFNQPNTKMELTDQSKIDASELHKESLKTSTTTSKIT